MGNTEEEAKARKFVEKLQDDDRITLGRPADPATGAVGMPDILQRPGAGPAPIVTSGDCADVREAIRMGLLERADDGTYRKRRRKP